MAYTLIQGYINMVFIYEDMEIKKNNIINNTRNMMVIGNPYKIPYRRYKEVL